jgi:hypothetical protein
MAFLDNSGDIILDAVLTDTGRFRLAKGDGSFKIAKFAFGDDEINYGLYDKTNSSGSAYYDLNILQSPVFEAFTNNSISLKSKLLSIPRNNLMYLPVLKVNNIVSGFQYHSSGLFVVAVDTDTETSLGTATTAATGLLYGETPANGGAIRTDQGLDTTEISPAFAIDSDLIETQYLVQIDNRLANIVSSVDSSKAVVSYIDDDNIASYYFSADSDLDYVKEITDRTTNSSGMVIAGPRGTSLVFKLQASLDLNSSVFLFNLLGNTQNVADATGNNVNCYTIDSNIRVTGVTTGYSIDIPVRFAKAV